MSDEATRVEEIRARAEAATPGPWGHWPEAGEIELITTDEPGSPQPRRGGMEIIATSIKPKEGWEAVYKQDGKRIYRDNDEPDAEFIAHARTDVPWLLDRLAEAEAEVEAAKVTIAIADRARDRHKATIERVRAVLNCGRPRLEYDIQALRNDLSAALDGDQS